MLTVRNLSTVVGLLTCLLQVQGGSKYYVDDENKPYEFGFNIEGQQHRHEKKDERGLIMGEFGFITADDVYHVTVYATDEEGNFKILSMKNIRLKKVQEKKPKEIPFPPSANQPQTQLQGPKPGPAAPVNTCSHCSIPTSTAPPQLTDIAVVSQDNQQYNPSYPDSNNQKYPGNYPQNYPAQNAPQPGDRDSKQFVDYPPQYENNPQYVDNTQYGENPQYGNNPQYEDNTQYGENPQYGNNPQNGNYPEKPTLISAQMQIVDPSTDIYSRGPGEQKGLPPGLNKGDMELLLYTFNYTVGFHGHHEKGYTNGAKKGYYYVTGRNGVRTRVDYEADEKGFRPKITQEVLDLISEDVPKEETEKDAKYGLQGYEFKWLYYPVESRRR